MNAMPNTVKSRFAGMLFGWLRHVENKDAGAPTPAEPRPPASPTPSPSRPDAGGEMELPLQPILEKLPIDLRAKMTKPAAELAHFRIAIPLDQVLPQLATGSVKISFGQLREAVPGLFGLGAEHDSVPVTVPLNEVLSRINPKWFARSSAQKTVGISEDITSPFSSPPRQTAPAATPRPANRPAPFNNPFNNRLSPSPVPASVAPAPSVAPPAPAVAMSAQTISPASPAAEKPARAAAPAPGPIIVPLAALSEHWPDPMRAEIAQLNLAGAHIALPFEMVQSALKRGQAVFLWRVLRAWVKPEPVLAVSVRDNLELSLPLKIIVPLFMAQCVQTARKPQTATPSAEIPDLISLNPRLSSEEPAPTPVAVPAATPVTATPVAIASKPAAPAPSTPTAPVPPVSRAAVPPPATPQQPAAATVPFAPVPSVAREPSAPISRVPATPAAAPQQPVAAPKPAVRMAPAQAAPALEAPVVRRATPAEIIKRAMALPGVAGAILALPDGLSVASQAPEGVDADMLAAFVPQIFDRASQSVTELRMGEMNSLSFTVGGTPWMILRGSMVYFAAFGRAGEALPPVAQLSALAAELDRKKQK
jgi:hypothetical protein